MSTSLKRQEELLQSTPVKVHEVKEQISAIENTPLLSNNLVKNFKISVEHLEDAKKTLMDLNPFA